MTDSSLRLSYLYLPDIGNACIQEKTQTQTEVRSREMKTGLTPDCQPGPTCSKTISTPTQIH